MKNNESVPDRGGGINSSERTRSRILDAALALFNERGTAAVSTNHIAEAAKLSVGNLYYHFKNREEIVLALFERNASETLVAFQANPNKGFSLGILEEMVSANYDILYRYRFFYRELIVLLHRDPALAIRFREHRRYGFASFEGLLIAFAQAGVMIPMPNAAVAHRLAVTAWLVSEFYITYLESDAAELPENFVAEGAALLRQVLEPYLVETANRG